MQPKDLLLHMALRDQAALLVIETALAERGGVLPACESLAIGRTTLYRAAESWPALARLIKRGKMPASVIGKMGGDASHARKRRKRG